MSLAPRLTAALLTVAGGLIFCASPPPEPAPQPDDAPAAVNSVPTAVNPVRQERQRPGDEPPEIQAGRVRDALAALDKLKGAVDGDPFEQRPGAATFRAAELEKLKELVAAACRGADAPCREILEHVAAAGLPFQEADPELSLNAIYAMFLSPPLRERAHIAASTVGVSLMERPDGKIRDIAFRIAVGSGAARRGQEDDAGRRVTTIPLRPRVGEPLWLVFEWLSACNDITMQRKGPDANGRVDLVPTNPCPEPPPEPERVVPRAIRAVWAGKVDVLGEAGLTVWLPDATRPIAEVVPRPEPPAEKPDGG